MAIAASRKPFSLAVVGTAVLLGALAAPALAVDSSISASTTPPVMRGTTGRQLWRIADYTTIELVAREPGAGANEHPWMVEPNALHAWLQQVTLAKGSGLAKPLFAIDELNNIVPSIVAALANARPDQDIALVSSARHEDNTFYGITAVTARLFVAGGHLNLIVHDARVDFYDAARGSGLAPHFTIGSRSVGGGSPIQSPTATNKRADWLVLGTVAPPVVAPLPAAVAAPVPPVAQPAPVVVAPAPVVAAPVAPPAPPATQLAPSDPEERLATLKRLYDKGLITKAEYEKKRAEIIQGL